MGGGQGPEVKTAPFLQGGLLDNLVLLPAPHWGLLFPCPPRQQELT